MKWNDNGVMASNGEAYQKIISVNENMAKENNENDQ